MRSSLIAVVTLFIGIAIALPVRDNDVDELVLHVNELRRQNSGTPHRAKRAADPERIPLLYDSYPGVVGPAAYDKRSFDEIDRGVFDRWLLKKAYDNAGSLIDDSGRRDESYGYGKRNFDEIDRSAFNGFNKRYPYGAYMLNGHRDDSNTDNKKRNFDEIDRSAFHGFKRNFDEIDRVNFNHLKKRNFDEIDRSPFHGFKRQN